MSRGKILTRLRVLLLFMVGLAVASCVVLIVSQLNQNNYLSKISLSSRQKALAEELGRKMYDIHRQTNSGADLSNATNDFKLTLNKWESAQKALITGSDHYGTRGDNSNASQEMLQQSSGLFVQGRDFLNEYIAQPQTYQIAQLDSGMVLLEGYIGTINNVTGKFLAESELQGQVTTTSIVALACGTVFSGI